MRGLIVIASLALTGCQTLTQPEARSCPMPNGELLARPTRAEPIPDSEPLGLADLLRVYIDDLERMRLEIAKLEALQAHGRLVCGWPAAGP